MLLALIYEIINYVYKLYEPSMIHVTELIPVHTFFYQV